MITKHTLIASLIIFWLGSGLVKAQTNYQINTQDVEHTIDINVYGHFLEHIYHSANGGLWGELVWNRSFERISGSRGEWAIEGYTIVQRSLSDNVRLLFGETSWQDYEITLQAKRLGGEEGFLVLFRAHGDDFYWLNIAGWSNTQHAIEKGSEGAGRWGVFNGLTKPGSVHTNVWYTIKIRCEGNHFQVWLNGTLLFDFTDDDAHLTGQPGIGTWITRAAYRNIVVTEIPSGDTLYNQLPDPGSESEADFPHWEKSANAKVYSHDDALNSEGSALIHNPGNGAAYIQQGALHIVPQNYDGSLWAKADTGTTLEIMLLEGEERLDEAMFRVTEDNWLEYNFQFIPAVSTTEGILRISVPDSGKVLIDQVSMMGQDSKENHGFRPDLLKAVDELQPPIIRWPGGCYASAYFWKDGIGKQSERVTYPIELWDDKDVNSFGTDEFIEMCRLTGAEPLIVINTGVLNTTCGAGITKKLPDEEYLQDALDWMEYCNGDTTTTWGKVRAANGHPEPYNVKYWEIDNETWAAGVNAYVDKVKIFSPAMREKYPDVKILACGSGSYDYSWNQTILDQCARLIDYISCHHYEDPNNYKTGVDTYEAFIQNLSGRIANSSNPDLEIYMSEWNVWSPIDWRCGLYAGGMLNMFERQGEKFTLGGPALWLRHASADAWNNAFINFNNSEWFPAPNYVVMKLWREHYAPYYLKMPGSASDLNAVATLSENKNTVYFKVVNTSTNNRNITLTLDDSFVPDSSVLTKVVGASLYDENTFSNPDNLKAVNGDSEINGQKVSFVSSGLSATVVEIHRHSPTGFENVGSSTIQLLKNVPNPFDSKTKISFTLNERTHAKLRIADISGWEVAILVNETLCSGYHEVVWNGKNFNCSPVKNGIYLYELTASGEKQSRKMILLR